MRVPLGVLVAIGCAAYLTQSAEGTAAQPPAQPQPRNMQNMSETNCRQYTTPITVGGKRQVAFGQACQQADGSWRIIQTSSGLPTQALQPPQAIYPYPYAYPYPDPYWTDSWGYGVPLFVGGSFFFGSRFHGFRHGGFHGGGFHGGGFHGGGFHGGGFNHGAFHGGFHGGGHGGHR
jgi:hypothetical protein